MYIYCLDVFYHIVVCRQLVSRCVVVRSAVDL
jgi:hypothetical protein